MKHILQYWSRNESILYSVTNVLMKKIVNVKEKREIILQSLLTKPQLINKIFELFKDEMKQVCEFVMNNEMLNCELAMQMIKYVDCESEEYLKILEYLAKNADEGLKDKFLISVIQRKQFKVIPEISKTIFRTLDSEISKKILMKMKKSKDEYFNLLYFTILYQKREMKEEFEDLKKCYSIIVEKKKEKDIKAVDVIVEYLISLISNESQLLRNIADLCFNHFCSEMTLESISSIMNVLQGDVEGEGDDEGE
ncbi:hypothetical protein O9G_006272, partial [Rozella allomycis CSF55]